MSEKPHDLKPRTKAFALRVIRMYSDLPKGDTVAQVLGKQVLRSGTSVGANYREASRGRSKAEFISKIGDCLKEIEETEYWLELLVDSSCVPATRMAELLDETRQLIAVFITIDKCIERCRLAFSIRPLDFPPYPCSARCAMPRAISAIRHTDREWSSFYNFQMLRRGHHSWRGELKFAPPKVPEVVRDQMFHTAGNRQLQDVVIIGIRQVGPPPEINRLPNCGRAEIVQQRLSFQRPRRLEPRNNGMLTG